MSVKLYVGNLPYNISEDELAQHFDSGNVLSTKIIKDRDTGRSKGFGFVEFDNEDTANEMIERYNNTELGGRQLKISIARERSERPERFGGGRGRGGGGYRG